MSEHKHPHLSPADQTKYDKLEPHQQRAFDGMVLRQEKYDRNKKWLDSRIDRYGWGLALPTDTAWPDDSERMDFISREISDEMTMFRFQEEADRDQFKQIVKDRNQ